MSVTKFVPANPLDQRQHETKRPFGNLNDADSSAALAEWMPAVDILEYSDRFELLVDLPGVVAKSVEITLDRGVLTLAGERRDNAPSDEKHGAVLQQYSERRLGRFHRRFILPDTVDSEKVTARGSEGVLEMVIPKQPKALPRRIAVDS